MRPPLHPEGGRHETPPSASRRLKTRVAQRGDPDCCWSRFTRRASCRARTASGGGRSAHDALSALRKGIIEQRQRWVIDADISKYFDSITHSHLRSFLDLRIKDGVARRMIDKWLKAGVLEEDALHRPVAGTPQGGVISPMLSNVYLHHVLDEWFENVAKPRLHGTVPAGAIRR